MYEKKYTERAEKALNLAFAAAKALGHNYVGSEHILLGLIREETGVAAQSLSAAGITYDAVHEREKRVVFTDTYVCAGMDFRSSLTNENVASEHGLTVATFRTESFCLAVSSVVGRTRTFFMSE